MLRTAAVAAIALGSIAYDLSIEALGEAGPAAGSGVDAGVHLSDFPRARRGRFAAHGARAPLTKETQHMFSRKKIAAVSGLLGGLTMTCIGATQAYAAGGPGVCTLDSEGNIVCVQRIVGETTEGDAYAVRRAVNCQPTQPLTLPAPGLLNNGQTRIGPAITCSSTTPGSAAPDNSDETENHLSLPGLLGG